MDFTPVFICGFLFLAVYKIIELLVHRRERIMLVEKLEKLDGAAFDLLRQNFGRRDESSSYWPLRIGALLVGLGFGILVSLLIIYLYPRNDFREWQIFSYLQSFGVLMGAGLGLLAAFVFEFKHKHKEEKK
ncbi:MAG: hypothetical protein J1D86_06815 [Alistipes sp.]|nr:hypothetical protein [Alistipes sp.]